MPEIAPIHDSKKRQFETTDSRSRCPDGYEDIRELSDQYVGSRYYVFPGGCVTYDFDFTGTGRTALANEASVGMALVTRQDVSRRFLESGLRL